MKVFKYKRKFNDIKSYINKPSLPKARHVLKPKQYTKFSKTCFPKGIFSYENKKEGWWSQFIRKKVKSKEIFFEDTHEGL